MALFQLYALAYNSIFCWVVSVLTGNYSQVDRLWSIIPVVYSWSFTLDYYLEHHAMNHRLLIVSVLITAWGSRLTYNFIRKGGYEWSSEDYRWPILRNLMPPWVYQIFNIVFIAFYQNLLLFLITAPCYIMYMNNLPLNVYDLAALFLFLNFFTLEVVADEQQWAFQTKKYELKSKNSPLYGEYADGFLSSGLFAYSRHPNYVGEFSMWWCIYLFSVAVQGNNWTVIGSVLLTLLFLGSTAFTEYISVEKYPKYKQYQAKVPALILL
jgi:steroid 5-alpha reductase family enzyme